MAVKITKRERSLVNGTSRDDWKPNLKITPRSPEKLKLEYLTAVGRITNSWDSMQLERLRLYSNGELEGVYLNSDGSVAGPMLELIE